MKLHPLILHVFILMHIVGLSQGSLLNQAGPLKALQIAKRKKGGHERIVETEQLPVSGWFHRRSSDEVVTGDMKDDLIKGGLMGQPKVKFNQYAGYVTVDQSNGRSLFYYFAEATQDSLSKPLLLWLNGGPGCSSFGFGAMVEIGPFGVKPDGKTLYTRRHAWNRVANTLFVESPVGVGFSYSNTTSDYDTSGDHRTAQDSYSFLVNWFKRFPHYKTRDFYIMGESYAGYYIPELADIIVYENKDIHGDSSSVIQLKGVMIGNGIMNEKTDTRGMYDYLWTHALISDQTHDSLIEHCVTHATSQCDTVEKNIEKEGGNIDYYNIYASLCPSNSSTKHTFHRGFDPCEEDYIYNYLNLPQVQEALHANITKLPYPWDFCSSFIDHWKDSPSTMFPTYRRLITAGLKILLFSGDVDSVVPVSSTRYSIDALKLTVTTPWHPWDDGTNEVAGYRVVYKGLTFATVRGAGHEVPRFQPRQAFTLMKSFIKGK